MSTKNQLTKFIQSSLSLASYGGKATKRGGKWIVHAHENAKPITVVPFGLPYSDLKESENWKMLPAEYGRAYVKAVDVRKPKQQIGCALVTNAEKITTSCDEMLPGQAYKLTVLARVYSGLHHEAELGTFEVFGVLILNPPTMNDWVRKRPFFKIYDNEHCAAVAEFEEAISKLGV